MTEPTALATLRERAKGPAHEALHTLGPHIPDLNVGECHCNLLIEVALDAMMPVITSEVSRLTAELAEARHHASSAMDFTESAQQMTAQAIRQRDAAEAQLALREPVIAAAKALKAHLDEAGKLRCSAGEIVEEHLAAIAASLTPDTEPKPRTWTLPPEPGPEVTRLRDQFGQYFERCDAYNDDGTTDDVWVGQEFLADAVIPDLTLPWEKLIRHHSPLVDATPDTEETSRGE